MSGNKLSQFFRKRYVISERDLVAEDYENSDFGRVYGWWVFVDGIKVASLEYRCFLEEPVHLYYVTVLAQEFQQIDLSSQKWLRPEVTIQSKYAEGFAKQGLQMAAVGNGMIVVENLFLPESFFYTKHKEISSFQQTLLEKAEKKADLETDQTTAKKLEKPEEPEVESNAMGSDNESLEVKD